MIQRTMMERSNWRTRGYRAETNQHEEMEMCAETSELISQTLNVLYTGLLLGGKETCYVTSGTARGRQKTGQSLVIDHLIILPGRKDVST